MKEINTPVHMSSANLINQYSGGDIYGPNDISDVFAYRPGEYAWARNRSQAFDFKRLQSDAPG